MDGCKDPKVKRAKKRRFVDELMPRKEVESLNFLEGME